MDTDTSMPTVDVNVWRKLNGERLVRTHPILACPWCGSAVAPMQRRRLDRTLALLRICDRYRCSDVDCAWEGTVLLPDADCEPLQYVRRRPLRARTREVRFLRRLAGVAFPNNDRPQR